MINPEKGMAQYTEKINQKEKPKSEPITSEQKNEAAGELGESKQDPRKYFEKELARKGEVYKGGLGLGRKEDLIRWDREAYAHAQERKKLETIISGLRSHSPDSIKAGIEYINKQMASEEENLAPLVQRENKLRVDIDHMKVEEKNGKKDYGFSKYKTKNQELDRLYAQLKKEKKLAEPNKFRLNDLENDIKDAEYIRDNSKFGQKVVELRRVQENIERINENRKKLDILLNRLKEQA